MHWQSISGFFLDDVMWFCGVSLNACVLSPMLLLLPLLLRRCQAMILQNVFTFSDGANTWPYVVWVCVCVRECVFASMCVCVCVWIVSNRAMNQIINALFIRIISKFIDDIYNNHAIWWPPILHSLHILRTETPFFSFSLSLHIHT